MTDFISRYERQLVDAARVRSAQPAWRRPRRSTRTAAIVAALLALSGTAIAATQPWRPLLGNGSHPGATATDLPPPADQLAALGVLRRPQTSADRGPQTTYALSFMGKTRHGVRTASIRLLHVEPDGRGFVLIPVAGGVSGELGRMLRHRAATGTPGRSAAPADAAAAKQLCVFSVDGDRQHPVGGGWGCYSVSDLNTGRAAASLGLRSYGLVPDGVARVRAEFPGGEHRETSVSDNFFVYTAPSTPVTGDPNDVLPVAPVRTVWLDHDGNVVKTIVKDSSGG